MSGRGPMTPQQVTEQVVRRLLLEIQQQLFDATKKLAEVNREPVIVVGAKFIYDNFTERVIEGDKLETVGALGWEVIETVQAMSQCTAHAAPEIERLASIAVEPPTAPTAREEEEEQEPNGISSYLQELLTFVTDLGGEVGHGVDRILRQLGERAEDIRQYKTLVGSLFEGDNAPFSRANIQLLNGEMQARAVFDELSSDPLRLNPLVCTVWRGRPTDEQRKALFALRLATQMCLHATFPSWVRLHLKRRMAHYLSVILQAAVNEINHWAAWSEARRQRSLEQRTEPFTPQSRS